MSKNSTVSDELNTLRGITSDVGFKSAVRYKAVAALLVKLTVPEFRNMSLTSIARSFVDSDGNIAPKNKSDADVLNSELVLLKDDIGTKDEKNTIMDTVFRIKLPDGKIENIKVEISNGKGAFDKTTINTEMQKITSERALGYNLVSRAVYYGASLLRNTVGAGNTHYEGIHKVYSIWFCGDNLGLWIPDEVGDRAIHKYGFRRFYDGIDKVVASEPFADLIEVVLVELKKLHLDDELENMVRILFYDTPSVVDMLEKQENVKLPTVRKGVEGMLNYDMGMKEGMKKGMEEGMEEGMKKGMEEGTKKGRKEGAKSAVEFFINDEQMDSSRAVEKTIKMFKLDDETAAELRTHFGV